MERRFELIDVAAVDDEIQRYGDTATLEPIENAELVRVRFRARDFIGRPFVGALKTQLHVIETRFDEPVEPRLVQRKPGRNHADIESCPASCTHQLLKIGAGQRLATGEINLQDARFAGFAEHPRPDFGREFACAMPQFHGIRTIHAVEWASMSDLGDDGERRDRLGSHWVSLLPWAWSVAKSSAR